ncbi:MAG: hypothetical protein JO079_04680 [Frankiaceae bacterium]|nr:hypothetical protein [Frankiaceae bacterium]MBV9369952.1 hypothetical protein [Frankiales bacterium]
MSTQRATTLLDLGRHAEALQALNDLGDEGLTATAHCLRARAYLGLNQVKEAERAAAAARAADPGNEWGYRLGAIVARQQLRPRVADELAAEAVRLAPYEPNAHQVCTLTAVDLGDVEGALAHSFELLRLAPHSADSHYTAGLAFATAGRTVDAEAAFRHALSIDPQHAPSMGALAQMIGRRDPEQAKQLRLAAVRTAPHVAHHRSQLLKRGGIASGGTLLAVGKFGLLGKIFAFGAIRSVALAVGGFVAVVVAVAAYVVAFVVSRVRRWRHGKTLPPLMWEGLKAERRNADLLWIAFPAGAAFVALMVVVAVELGFGHSPVHTLVYALGALGLLVVCWLLRRGDARKLRVRDIAAAAVGTVRVMWQRRRARRRRANRFGQSRTW